MSSDSPGCLGGAALAVGAVVLAPFLALYSLVVGKQMAKQGDRPRLPYLAISRMHAKDRPALNRAGKAAQQCIDALYDSTGDPRDLGEAVAREVASEVQQLLGKIHELGQQLTEARAYVKRHDPDGLAREQADLEIQLEEASNLDERRSLNEAMGSLEERARHAATVSQELRTLSAQLTAATHVLETLQARLSRLAVDPSESTVRTDEVLDEVREHQKDAQRALEAYAATARELH